MNFEEEFIKWADGQFSIKVPAKELASLIQSKKNGPIVQKVLQFFVAHVNSKKNGKMIKTYCDYIECCKEIEKTQMEIDRVKDQINQLTSSYEMEERNLIKMKKEIECQEFIIKIRNVFEELTMRTKNNIKFEFDSKVFDQLNDCYEQLFFDKNNSKTINGLDSQLCHVEKLNCNCIIFEINNLMKIIGSILHEINCFESEKLVTFSIDQAELIRKLVSFKNKDKQKEIQDNKATVENDAELLAKNVEQLSQKYNKIRKEQLNLFKDKLVNFISNCEDMIQKVHKE